MNTHVVSTKIELNISKIRRNILITEESIINNVSIPTVCLCYMSFQNSKCSKKYATRENMSNLSPRIGVVLISGRSLMNDDWPLRWKRISLLFLIHYLHLLLIVYHVSAVTERYIAQAISHRLLKCFTGKPSWRAKGSFSISTDI